MFSTLTANSARGVFPFISIIYPRFAWRFVSNFRLGLSIRASILVDKVNATPIRLVNRFSTTIELIIVRVNRVFTATDVNFTNRAAKRVVRSARSADRRRRESIVFVLSIGSDRLVFLNTTIVGRVLVGTTGPVF